MNSLYLVPFSQLPIELCHHWPQLLALPQHACALGPPLDLTPLVPSGLWFALSTHRHLGMPPGRMEVLLLLLCFVHSYLGTTNLRFCICLQVCLLTMENNLRTRTITFQL